MADALASIGNGPSTLSLLGLPARRRFGCGTAQCPVRQSAELPGGVFRAPQLSCGRPIVQPAWLLRSLLLRSLAFNWPSEDVVLADLAAPEGIFRRPDVTYKNQTKAQSAGWNEP